MNKNDFIKYLENLNINISTEKLQLLQKYCDFLLDYNKTTNLTAIKDEDNVYLKHFYDSLTINKYLNNVNTLLDIGTGAGFPGMVIAIMHPEIHVTLLDSNNKKIKFLEELIKILGITNVSLIYGRCETFAKDNKEKFDIVTSRAVARLRILCELALPLLKINGKFIAMKGNITDEIIEANDTISILNSKIIEQDIFKLPIENSNRENVVIKKINSCDDKYPRDYDKIIKKPLVKKQ